MAQTPEAKVKAFIRKTLNSWYPDLWYYSPPGGPFGRSGIPDHFYLIRGVFVAIEAKAAGNTPTANQVRELKAIAKNGAIADVVTGRDLDRMHAIKLKIDAELHRRERATI